jgi:hypothetical protein
MSTSTTSLRNHKSRLATSNSINNMTTNSSESKSNRNCYKKPMSATDLLNNYASTNSSKRHSFLSHPKPHQTLSVTTISIKNNNTEHIHYHQHKQQQENNGNQPNESLPTSVNCCSVLSTVFDAISPDVTSNDIKHSTTNELKVINVDRFTIVSCCRYIVETRQRAKFELDFIHQ